MVHIHLEGNIRNFFFPNPSQEHEAHVGGFTDSGHIPDVVITVHSGVYGRRWLSQKLYAMFIALIVTETESGSLRISAGEACLFFSQRNLARKLPFLGRRSDRIARDYSLVIERLQPEQSYSLQWLNFLKQRFQDDHVFNVSDPTLPADQTAEWEDFFAVYDVPFAFSTEVSIVGYFPAWEDRGLGIPFISQCYYHRDLNCARYTAAKISH